MTTYCNVTLCSVLWCVKALMKDLNTHHNHQKTLLEERGSFFGNTLKGRHINTIAFLHCFLFVLLFRFTFLLQWCFFFLSFRLEVFDFSINPLPQSLTQPGHSTMLSTLRTTPISTVATRHASTCAVCFQEIQTSHRILSVADNGFLLPFFFFGLSTVVAPPDTERPSARCNHCQGRAPPASRP